MNGEQWEGWEAYEERVSGEREEEREGEEGAEGVEFVGVLWMGDPPPAGLAAVGGGTEIVTPKGRRVRVGIAPGMLSEEGVLTAGRAADHIIDHIKEENAKNPRTNDRLSWLYTVLEAARKFADGSDKETLWKVATILTDFEDAMNLAEHKGYVPEEWLLQDLVAALPDNEDGHLPKHEEGEEE